MYKTDILVLGTGLAGAIAAIAAAEKGRKVTVATKTKALLSGSTAYAQGGIIFKGIHDSAPKLKEDVIKAGAGACWEPAVNQLCDLGPRLVQELLIDKYSVNFDRDENNELEFTSEGAHSEPRVIHTKDTTGKTIQEAVINELLRHPNIEVLTNHTSVDLLTLSHHSYNPLDIYMKPACFGAFMLNNETGEIFPIFASKTILATGGLGQIFIHTTNPREATGDGIAMAWRAGVRCFNLQYVQFHPTTLYTKGGDRFLLSEAMRGEGARLIDKNGKEFMKEYHPQGSLAPRDIVSRGIHQTMLDTDHPCVYLDITHKNPDWVKDRFPNIYQTCMKAGYDISAQRVPVVPAAHYSCGGVGVSLKGKTSLQRLYAVGEVACTGVHGANRLASTSLLESVVWGYEAGNHAADTCDANDYYPEVHPWQEEVEFIDPALIAQDWHTIKNTMWNYVGLVRTKQRLDRAQTILRHLQTEVEEFYRRAKMTRAIIELRNGIQSAYSVTSFTREARLTLGTHFMQ